MGILPKRRRKRKTISDIKRALALFIVFLGLSVIIHETFHLVVARALGYEANVFYGIRFPNIYGVVYITPPSMGPLETILIFSAGGLGAGMVLLILWITIDDIIAKLLLSFFTVAQFVYGVMEPMYGLGLLPKPLLETIPMLAGIIALIIFRIMYQRLGWW